MVKRVFDFIVSTAGLVLLSPFLLTLSLLVVLKLGRPLFFTQTRPGKGGRPFRMIKFRTMTNETNEMGDLLPNEDRMTRFGSFLRSSSLDELPELFNVVKGDMSLVGPRPLLMEYLPWFTEEQSRRHEVKPGITGWSQVNGRNAIGWEKKLALDIWYVENYTLWLDIKILFMTFVKVYRKDGINHSEELSMPRFDEFMKQKSNKNHNIRPVE
jgi:lipopolysaccharide/colanic/teichoic acid biosynthesis glycosyltransferase